MRTRWPAVAVAGGVVVFGLLTVLVAAGATAGLDGTVARLAARHETSAGVTTARVLTDVFSPGVDAVLLLLGAGLLGRRQRRRGPVVVAVCVIVVVSIVVLGLKDAIDRPLPRSHGLADEGFPSGHTAATVCFLGTLALLASRTSARRRCRLLTAVAVVSTLVMAALVSARFHWLTDTIASAALGVAVVGGLAGQWPVTDRNDVPAQPVECSSPNV
jgi:membrane-associated phospholipid phosphatase